MAEQTSATPVFSHYPVMLSECIEGLHIKENGIYVDCTTGGGGHSFEIASRLSDEGRLICIDQDTTALAAAKERLAPYLSRVTFVHDNFSNVRAILDRLGIEAVDGALIDLGVSSYQLDTPERGFSYQHDAPLDMRMNEEQALSAYDVVNTYSKEALQKLIFAYGEERFAPRIAQGIMRARENGPIKTTFELVDIINDPDLGICIDTGHAHLSGMDVGAFIRMVGSRLKCTHIDDNRRDGDTHLPPYFGTSNWEDIMKAFDDANYKGDFSFEVSGQRFPPHTRNTWCKFMHDLGADMMAKKAL
jgi:hypothetical protein